MIILPVRKLSRLMMHPSSPWLNISMLLSAQVIKCFITDLKQGIIRKLPVLEICSVYCFKDAPCFNSIEFDGVTPLPPKRTPEAERKHEPGNQLSAVPGRNLPLLLHHIHDPVPTQPEREISCLNIAGHCRPAGCTAYIK